MDGANGAGAARAASAEEDVRLEAEASGGKAARAGAPRPAGVSPTPRQRELLVYLSTREACPTQSEMRRAIGATRDTLINLLDGLEERGFIRRRRHRVRAVEVLRPVTAPAVHRTREQGLADARAWHLRMKPYFDALYGPDAPGERRAG